MEDDVKSLKEVPLNLIDSELHWYFIIVHGGFKKINVVSFEICPFVGLANAEILFLL